MENLVGLCLVEFRRKTGCDARESRRAMVKVFLALGCEVYIALYRNVCVCVCVSICAVRSSHLTITNNTNPQLNPHTPPRKQLRRECEAALRTLSTSQQADVEIDALYEGCDLRCVLGWRFIYE